MGSNLLRYAFTERNILSYIQHPYIAPRSDVLLEELMANSDV